VVLHCNYEELKALRDGARAFLEGSVTDAQAVAAPPEDRARVEGLVPLLEGTLSIRTLKEQRRVREAVDAVVAYLRAEMELFVTTTHPASEGAVAAYFDFAHALSVQHRIVELGSEMTALVEVVTGRSVTDDVSASFVFPD